MAPLGVPSKVRIACFRDASRFSDSHKADGSVGGTAQKVGGPFDKEGAVGKQFTEGGALGGTVQSAAETAQGEKPSAFDAEGMIGKQFTSKDTTIPISFVTDAA